VRVRLVLSPGSAGSNRFDATVVDYDSGRPVPADTVSLRFQVLDQPDIGEATLDLARGADSHWRGSGRAVSIDGRWSVTAVVQTRTDAVEVPMSLVTRASGSGGTAVQDAGGTCGDGQPDPAYSVSVDSDPNPPRAEATTFHLTVRHDGKAVTGARVCLIADMPDMQHPGVSKVAKEASPGRYDAELKFGMEGAWSASVAVAEPGRAVALVPIKFQVR
jgi:hypothetical protein